MTTQKRKTPIKKQKINKNTTVTKEESNSDSGSDYESFYGFSDHEEENESSTDTETTTTARIKGPLKIVAEEEEEEEEESDTSDDDEMNEKKRKQKTKVEYIPRPTNRKSPWLLFCSEHRSNIINENPDLQGREVQRKLVELYHSLPENERERYRQEYQVYKEEINNQRQIRPRNQKLPGNGYIQYTKFITPQIKTTHPECSMKERNRLIASGWKELGKEGQQKYVDKAKLLLENFIKENPEYYAIHLKRSLAKRRATSNERKKKEKKSYN